MFYFSLFIATVVLCLIRTYIKYVNLSLSLSPCAAIRKEIDEIEEGKYTTENNVLKVTVYMYVL